MSGTGQPNNLELLRIQAEGSFNDRGRLIGLYGITIASAREGQVLWIGADVPDALTNDLVAAFESAAPSLDPTVSPPALEPCERLLNAISRGIRRQAGPSYLIDTNASFSSGAQIERSDVSTREGLRDANPGNWHPVEWNELLEGRLGPWAMATEGDRVISICHTPVPVTDRFAECGVWTHPEFRGRGHAAAVTSEWAAMLRPSGRFSSTARMPRTYRRNASLNV